MSTYEQPVEPERPPEERRAPDSGRHPVNVGHLVMGVAFLGLVTVWSLLATDTLELEDSRWLLPLPWLAAGAVGLAAMVFRGRGLGHHGRAGRHFSHHLKGWH